MIDLIKNEWMNKKFIKTNWLVNIVFFIKS